MSQAAQEVIGKIADALQGVVDFSGEMMLLDWSKSTAKDGPKVKFMLAGDEEVEPFEEATIKKGKIAGQIYHVFAIRIDEDTAKMLAHARQPKRDPKTIDLIDGKTDDEKKAGNELARELMVKGYFRNPRLWEAMHKAGFYTQEDHRQYVKTLGCCGPRLATGFNCSGDVVPHHVNRPELPAAGEGMYPNKVPHWYTIPLCFHHHQLWAHGSNAQSATKEDRERQLLKAVEITAGRMKEKVKELIGIKSLADITPQQLRDFEERIGLR